MSTSKEHLKQVIISILKKSDKPLRVLELEKILKERGYSATTEEVLELVKNDTSFQIWKGL